MESNQLSNKLRDLLSMRFALLDSRKDKLFLVVFFGLFTTLFIFYFNPFSIQEVQYGASIGSFLSIWTAGVVGAFILAITHFVLRPLFNLSHWTVGQFILWLSFDFICLTVGVYLIFGEYHRPFFSELFLTLHYTISLSFLPYALACLLLAVCHMSARLKHKEDLSAEPDNHIFRDDQGKVILIVAPEDILYLKSEGNYSSIFYLQNDKVERKLSRTTLKQLEEELKYPYVLRIHRSHMINLKFMASISREKGTYHVSMKHIPGSQLKVSDSYKSNFESKVNSIENLVT